VDKWKRSFLDKLHDAQSQCAKQFEESLNRAVTPVFDEFSSFLADNGFKVSTPLSEHGRRSFKYELSENAYLLLIFRFTGIGDYELRTEILAPGNEPVLDKSVGRVSDIDKDWARKLFQGGLDRFVDLLGGRKVSEPKADPVLV
jgi:hypothetical protein